MERRKHKRFPAKDSKIMYKTRYKNSSKHLTVAVINVSKGGLKIKYDPEQETLRDSDEIIIKLLTKDDELIGKVVWVNENRREAGIKFITLRQ